MNTWVPSRKWIAATVVALGTIATAWAQAGEWTTTLTVMSIGVVVQAATSYLLPNADGERSSWGARAREQRGQIEPLNLLVYVIVIIILIVVLFAVIDRI